MAPIIDYSAPVKVSEYAPLVAEELAGLLKAGDNKASTFVVPTADAGRVKELFSREANAAGKTARWRDESNDGKVDKDGNPTGKTTFIVTLTDRHAARRKAGDSKTTAKSE